MSDPNIRITEKLYDDGWRNTKLCHLAIGDIFRMFEDDGEPVKGHDGSTQFKATGAPHVREDGVWAIEADNYK